MKKKKGKLKWILIVIVVIGIIGSFSDDGEESTIEESASVIEAITDEETVAEEQISQSNIELIAGEQGQYGKLITMSEGTDMEESFYAYYIPSGTYEVTNIGKYMTQVNVYAGFAMNEETGYDEYTDIGSVILLDVDKTDVIEVPEGWFIEIHEPTHISLSLTNAK